MIWIIVALVVAIAWDTNNRAAKLDKKLDAVLESLRGLRHYLYEIDPQFDEERRIREDILESDYHGGLKPRERLKQIKESGKRTLDTPFIEPARPAE